MTSFGARVRLLAVALAGSFAFAACSGGGSQIAPTPQTHTAAVSTAPGDSNIWYAVSPPSVLSEISSSTSPALLTPSQCVKNFGLACYTPALIRTAYNVPASLDGSGQTIAIVDAYGNPTVAQDLHIFDLVMGLPDPPSFKIAYPAGPTTGFPASHNASSWEAETDLDVQWAHAIAPKANIVLVVVPNNRGDVLNVGQAFVVDNHLANVMSLSFGFPEIAIVGARNNTQVKQSDRIYQNALAANIGVFASAGDSGATDGTSHISANYPASNPAITSVGGTNLFISDTGAYQSETVWNDSNPSLCPFGCKDGAFGATGGAPSILYPAPSYQAPFSHSSRRTVSDVGYNASVYTGVLVFFGFPGIQPGFYFVGGTSEGAPQWAGLAALANQHAGHALGFLSPQLYAAATAHYAADFHDVTVGDNGFFGAGFPATAGYDIPTGLGSPNAANLFNDLH